MLNANREYVFLNEIFVYFVVQEKGQSRNETMKTKLNVVYSHIPRVLYVEELFIAFPTRTTINIFFKWPTRLD